MKKLLIVALLLNALLLAGRLWQEMPVNAQQVPPPASCGDVNGDGNLNLSDPVYLLNHLFLGGQEPVCPASGGGSLPATGQTTCHDASERVIPCDSATCRGQDGFYQTGCPTEGRFVDNGDGTVTDTCTGLMWQKGNAPGRHTYCEALAYCENLTLAGDDDWRLPNIQELQSIADYGRRPRIAPVFGTLVDFWSSTSFFPSNPGRAWLTADGSVIDRSKATSFLVRAVRTAR